MRQLFQFLFVAAGAMALCSCSTLTVSPESKNLVWQNGHGFETISNERVRIRAALDYQSRDQLRFFVEIKNTGKSALVISPEDFRLNGPGLEYGVAKANDPEGAIAAYNKQIEDNNEQLQPTFAESLSDFADTLKETSGHATAEQKAEHEKREAHEKEQHNTARDNINYLNQRKHEMETRYLRRNTLAPGKTVAGLVAFSISLQAGAIDLVYPVIQPPLKLHFHSRKD